MLVDDVVITVQGGDGGDGAITFLHMAGKFKGGPNGGDGGRGGDIYLQGTDDMMALQQFQFKKVWKAENGKHGAKKNLFGRDGKDLVIKVPIGTRVTSVESKQSEYTYKYEKNNFEFTDTRETILIASGGEGGRGNAAFKSATNQAPRYAEDGKKGTFRKIRLELRLIADVGLIGLPNAGKSSLLAALTNAHPKVANYPFTTLEPNLGVMLLHGNKKIIIADIPGLIEGASHGKGLGFKFLRHIEKTKLLVHCIEATRNNIVEAYDTVKNEFEKYNSLITEKPEIIFLTKSDLTNSLILANKQDELKKINKRVYIVSIYDQNALQKMKETIAKILANQSLD